jgi:glycosyltransferase involved in cell wall biosynthesis
MDAMAEKKTTKKVVFCVPIVRRPYDQFIASLEASIPLIKAAGWEEELVQEINNPYISGARSTMLRKALDHGADVIVFLDYDLAWPAADLLKLIETKGDVVAGTYRCKIDDEQYMGTIFSGLDGSPIVRDDGCVKAHVAPAGFLKVTKEAVEAFMSAYPELCYGPKYHLSVDLFNHGAHGGLWWGEDYAFCRRWVDKCGELWILPDLSLTHWMADKPHPGNFHQFLLRQDGGWKSANPKPAGKIRVAA